MPHLFHVSGTHCDACKIYIEDTLSEEEFIRRAQVNLAQKTLEIETTDPMDAESLAQILTEKIASQGYRISLEKTVSQSQTSWQGILLGLGVLVVFFALQKSGILNIGLGSSVTPTTSFVIGLIASVSSCLAIVGGLVLSLAAKMSQDDVSDTKTFTLFHIGRIVSFAILGGILGTLGQVIGINPTFASILGILASLTMIILGLNLVGVLKKSPIALPASVFQSLRRLEHTTFTPLILGFATFFLPCGFTQSMQIVALSSGSFTSGLLIMLSFALGTLPMLLLLSFGSSSLAHSRYASLFFVATGMVVLGFGVFSLLGGLVGLGVINTFFSV